MPPTGTSYTAGIDVVTRDSNGFRTPLEGETIRIRLLDGTVLAVVTAENQGFVPPQTLVSVDSETEVEFYCPGRTGTLRMFTARTPEETVSVDVTLILDDAFTDTKTSEFAEVYLRDNTDPNIPLKYLGSQPKDSVRLYPFETSTPKDLDIFAVPRTSKFEYGTAKPEDSAFDSLAAVGGLTLDYTKVTGFPTNTIAGRATAGAGALESLSLPAIFSIGAGAVGLATQSANKVFSGPTSGGASAPTFRSLVAADIPSLDAAKIATGTLAAARLGSGSGGSTKFLREDSTWQTVAASPAGSNTQLQFNNSGAFGASGNLTFTGGNSLFVQTSSSSAVPLTVKGASGQDSGANYCEIKRSDNAVLFSFDEDSVGGVFGVHANNGTKAGHFKINPGGAASGMEIGGYNYLHFINLGSTTADLTIDSLGSAGGAVQTVWQVYSGKNFIFGGYNGFLGEVVMKDLSSGSEVFHAYLDSTYGGSSNPGVRFPTGKIMIGAGAPSEKLHLDGNFQIADAGNIVLGTSTGTKIGTGNTQKIGFWNATPVVQQVLATGASHTVDDVITFLQTIGLCKQS